MPPSPERVAPGCWWAESTVSVTLNRLRRALSLMLDLFSIEHLSRKLAICFGSLTVRRIFKHRFALHRCLRELDGLEDGSFAHQLTETVPKHFHSFSTVRRARVVHGRHDP